MRKLLRNKKGFSNLVPMVLAVVITFAVLFIGAFINGEITQQLKESYPAQGASRTMRQNITVGTLNNTSDNWDTAIDIVQVVIIITILAAAIGAIFMFTRFGTG